jgi:tetratricopeptide (TPR) repeat protein
MKRSDSDLESEEKLREKIALGSQDPAIYCRLAELLFAAGRQEEAISFYERALTLPLTGLQRAKVSAELGWLFYEMGKETQALSLARAAAEILSKELESPEVLAWRGASESLRAHCIWSNDEKAGAASAHSALECLKKVMVEAPDFDDIDGVYYDAARLSNLLWAPRDTIVFCEKCLRCDLDERERLQCLVAFAEALRQEERFTDAEKALQEALKLATADITALPRLHLEIGIVKRLQSRLEEAQHSLQQALQALESHPYWRDDPQFLTHVYGNLGELYYESGQYVEAMAAFQKIIGCHPNDDAERREAFRWLGQSYHATGRYAEARDCYEQVLNSPVSSEAEKASVQAGLGKVYYDEGDYEQGVATFETIVASFPEDNAFHCDVLLWLGCSYQALALDAKARDCFEQVLKSPHASEAEVSSAQKRLSRLPPSPKKTLH